MRKVAHVDLPNVWLASADRALAPVPTSVSILGSTDRMFFDQDRAVAVEGRLPDPRRADEMMVTSDAARALGVHVGAGVGLGVPGGLGVGVAVTGTIA